jgi:hypothetical protein
MILLKLSSTAILGFSDPPLLQQLYLQHSLVVAPSLYAMDESAMVTTMSLI